MVARFCEDASAALEQLLKLARARDVVLVKASRGVGAERIAQGLLDSVGRAA
jgi:UDP-N-acetylmuramyl pentapeptide synthase